MIHHHPDEGLLLAHATGSLPSAAALLTATHVEGCVKCRSLVKDFEALGGTVLADETSAALAPDALHRLLRELDAPPLPAPAAVVRPRPPLPAGLNWPRSMRHCQISAWRPIAPGTKWSRVRLPYDPAANLFLFRIAAGRCLPPHTHSDSELTQVLYGSFDDGRHLFGPGDFDATDASVHHQPVVQAASECLCLAAVDGRLLFDSRLARWMGSLVGM